MAEEIAIQDDPRSLRKGIEDLEALCVQCVPSPKDRSPGHLVEPTEIFGIGHRFVVVTPYSQIRQLRQPANTMIRIGIISHRVSEVQYGVDRQILESPLYFP
jgi:hypothetical protein